tara:strand:+ start:2452 stop:2988 length:537 start_codon:yes stop_codon:yes gene_type:complete
MMAKPKFPKSLKEKNSCRIRSSAINTAWHKTQKSFVPEEVEFAQDQRILDFFDDRPIYGIGNIEYFPGKLNIVTEDDPQSYKQALAIVNVPTSDLELFHGLECIKHIDKVCVSVNKYKLWTQSNKDSVTEDYDIALLEYIKTIFPNRQIEHFYVKGLKGQHFNFASPTTQFFITNENN